MFEWEQSEEKYRSRSLLPKIFISVWFSESELSRSVALVVAMALVEHENFDDHSLASSSTNYAIFFHAFL